jgi:tRNA-2-methylthio-N6-dimethylallyladenosine synthase
MPLVYFETFGCQMNVADSDELTDALLLRGFTKTQSSTDADVVVINTCSVREHAEVRALARISQHAAHKKQHKKRQSIWVMGCMAQRMGESLLKKIPGIDRVIGAREFASFLANLDAVCASERCGRPHTAAQGGVSRFVPIMRGCNNGCAYCVVPLVRGPEVSLPAAGIEGTVKSLVDKGAKEVTLLGQNVNSYRDGATDFSSLLRRLHAIDGLHRIRFTTSHPKDCTEQLVMTMAQLPKLCKHLHLPVQSGARRVLSIMNRNYTPDGYLRLIDMIRKHLPHADITTDAMVGFPTETEQEYNDTLSLFRTVRFTAAFMFMYSARPGTEAGRREDDVPLTEKKRRLKELIDVQTSITRQRYAAMVGTECAVLFTARQDGGRRLWMGQDMGCKRALFACKEPLAGTILNVPVTKSTGMTLICETTPQ